MKNWLLELTEGKTLTEVKIQKGIFQGDALSPFLFVIAMISFNNLPRKRTGGYEFTKLQEKINHFVYIDDIKLLAKEMKNN